MTTAASTTTTKAAIGAKPIRISPSIPLIADDKGPVTTVGPELVVLELVELAVLVELIELAKLVGVAVRDASAEVVSLTSWSPVSRGPALLQARVGVLLKAEAH